MSLVDIMIDQLGAARHIVEDHGAELIPAWRIAMPEGLLPGLHPLRPRQAGAAPAGTAPHLALYGLEAGDEASCLWPRRGSEPNPLATRQFSSWACHAKNGLACSRGSRNEAPLVLGPPEWQTADQIDEAYIDLLPSMTSEISLEEIAELSAIFGKGGGMEAERLS